MLNKYSKSLSYNDMEIFVGYNPPKDLYVEVRALEDIGIINIKDSGNTIDFINIYLSLTIILFFSEI